MLLTGDWHATEDLVQASLAKLYCAWPRIQAAGPDAYMRQVIAGVGARMVFYFAATHGAGPAAWTAASSSGAAAGASVGIHWSSQPGRMSVLAARQSLHTASSWPGSHSRQSPPRTASNCCCCRGVTHDRSLAAPPWAAALS